LSWHAVTSGSLERNVSCHELSYGNREGTTAMSRTRACLASVLALCTQAPHFLRMAFHDAGTYDKTTKKGGANGSFQFEQNAKANADDGLKKALKMAQNVCHLCDLA
jgi:Peroxidase